METTKELKDLLDFFCKYADKLEEVQKTQDFKLSTLISGGLKQLEKTISEQQASIMSIQSLENKRIKMQQAAGFGTMTFKEILVACDESHRKELGLIFNRIADAVGSIKYSNEKAMRMAKENFDVDTNPQKDYGYNEEQNKNKKEMNNTSFLQTKI